MSSTLREELASLKIDRDAAPAKRRGNWLPSRLWLYRRPLLAAAYRALS